MTTGLVAFRQRILRAVLVTAAVLGTVAYVPSVILAVQVGYWHVVIGDTIALLGVLGLLFARGLTYTQRAAGIIALVYSLAVLLTAAIGMPGAGLVWLTAFPVLAALLLGMRAAIHSLILFAITCAGFAGAIAAGWWRFTGPAPSGSLPIALLPPETDLLLWAVNAVNALAVAALLALALATLLRGLESAQQSLEAANRSLADAIAERDRSQAARGHLEAQLRQAHKLEAVGRLAGGIAHDFNNLLVPMLVYTDEVRRELPAGSTAWDRLGEVLQSAERARSLVRRILLFSRRAVVARGPARLDAIVREAGGLLRAAMPPSVEIRYAFVVTGADAIVVADPAELHQIAMNLGTNAAYAMRERGGRLTFHLDHVQDGRLLRLRVLDTGVGMDAATLERAFDPFFTTKPTNEGSGLGLATVHGIVSALQGEVTLTSEPGHGTTVEVLLPRVATPGEGEDGTGDGRGDATLGGMSAAEPPLAPGAGQRVLLVDDEPAVLAACEQLLRRLNYATTACESPARALELVSQQPASFDILVTDQAMPGMSGAALAEAVRRLHPDLPIILATGFLDEEARSLVDASGINYVLAKPYTLQDLSGALRTVLGSRVRR